LVIVKGFKTIFFLLLIVGFSSCKKETIEDPIPEQTPVFTANGSLNGNSFEIIAGEENATMQTMTRLENGVKLYTGILGNNNESIEFGIHEGNIDLASISNLNHFSGSLQFARIPSEPLLMLSKELLPNAMMIDQIKWYVNGVFAGIDDVEIIYPGKYNICAEVVFFDGMQSTLCNEMIAGYHLNASYKLTHYLNQTGNLKVWLDEATEPISSVEWLVDDVLYCPGEMLNIGEIGLKSYKITSRVTFTNGVVRTRSILVDGSLSGKFIEDFSIFENEIINEVFWDYTVSIKFKKDGITYSTAEADNSNATIIVNDMNYFGLNSSGNQVFKCNASVNCFVTDPSNGSQIPLNFNTQLGVEIKD